MQAQSDKQVLGRTFLQEPHAAGQLLKHTTSPSAFYNFTAEEPSPALLLVHAAARLLPERARLLPLLLLHLTWTACM
jgi:hypothetical protein